MYAAARVQKIYGGTHEILKNWWPEPCDLRRRRRHPALLFVDQRPVGQGAGPHTRSHCVCGRHVTRAEVAHTITGKDHAVCRQAGSEREQASSLLFWLGPWQVIGGRLR